VLEATGGLEVSLAGELAAGWVARRGDQYPTGAGFCASHRTVSQDGSAGCPGARPFCGSDSAPSPSGAQCPNAGVGRAGGAPSVTDRVLTAEKNRLRLAARPIQKRVQAHITWLEKELGSTNTDLTAMMRESSVWGEKEEVLRSVPGVGPVLTTTLFANLPELGTLTRKEVAALAGVAPFLQDSGTLKGRRAIWGGRAHVRTALYMAGLVATRKTR
jgi:transposase